MMRQLIAITGGIGSGKSYVCQLLEKHGIKVYDCDAAAKRLMRTSATLRQQLRELVGPQVYRGCILQKRVLAEFLLASEANKQAVNEIVHPAVALDFVESDYQWLESAILFDSGFHRRVPFSFVVCVSAPEDVRVQRIMARDGISEAKALEWILRQMPQEQVEAQSNFVILNDGVAPLEPQVAKLLESLRPSSP